MKESNTDPSKVKTLRTSIVFLIIVIAIGLSYKLLKTDPEFLNSDSPAPEAQTALENLVDSPTDQTADGQGVTQGTIDSHGQNSRSYENPEMNFGGDGPFNPKAGSKNSGGPKGFTSGPKNESLTEPQQNRAAEKEFRLNEHDVKAIRENVKSHMLRAYTAQKKYFAKYRRYSTDLSATGWLPHEPNLNFKAGFLTAYSPDDFDNARNEDEDPKKMDTDFYEGTLFFNQQKEFKNKFYAYSESAKKIELGKFSKYCRKKCSANSKYFEMLIAVPLASGRAVDVWLLTNSKEMKLVHDGYEKSLN